MKKITILIFFLPFYYFLLSNTVSIELAKDVAISFMIQKKNNTNIDIKSFETILDGGLPVYYIFNLTQGGWVLVSASKTTSPILGYSLDGEFKSSDEKPEPLSELLVSYKEQISISRNAITINDAVVQEWKQLENSNKLLLKTYSPGTVLLNTSRGHVHWGQSINNSSTCSPSYNQLCGSSSDGDCPCAHKPVGCGAVAMGQIMWYWGWPYNINWQNIPSALFNSTDPTQAYELQKLLRNLGSAVDMTYWCDGSWTTTNNIRDAYTNSYDYRSAEKKIRNQWTDGVWLDLIRTEIDCERPVLYRGDKCDACPEKHFWVIDGYDIANNNLFHCNWGMKGNYDDFYNLNDLTPNTYDFNKNQMAIIGISPSYSVIPNNISDVDYTTVTDTKTELARGTISLPTTGKSLTVNSGGNYTLSAANSIKLKPGFTVKSGAVFQAITQNTPSFGNDCGIGLLQIEDAFYKGRDDHYGVFEIQTENANSYEIIVVNKWDVVIYQGAGKIDVDGITALWDGTGADFEAVYMSAITLRNNCGERIIKEKDITVFLTDNKSAISSIDFNYQRFLTLDEETSDIEEQVDDLIIYPNPSDGAVFIETDAANLPYRLNIYNSLGIIVYHRDNVNIELYKVNLNDRVNGLAIIEIISDNRKIIKQIIIQ
jgi:hypothetical protein